MFIYVFYIDPNKKRTNNWLQARRLQLPVGVTSYGSIGRVTLFERNVKGEVEIGSGNKTKTPMQIAFENARKESTNTQSMQNGKNNSSSGQFSFLPPEMAESDKQDVYQEEGERKGYIAEEGNDNPSTVASDGPPPFTQGRQGDGAIDENDKPDEKNNSREQIRGR